MPPPICQTPAGTKDRDSGSMQHLSVQERESNLVRLHRREWSIWYTALLIMLCLAAGLAALSLSAAKKDSNVLESVGGLTLVIILFACYSTYEKFLINRLRLEVAHSHLSSAAWREVALVDPLTGLYNRRFAEKRLKEEILRSQRKGYPLTLVAFDLNNFKKINDEFGHATGDAALKLFAESLRKLARESDVAARFAGDEFLILLTECDADQAEATIGRLKPENLISGERIVPIQFAFGWTQYRPGDQPKDMMTRADELLYQNKSRRKEADRIANVQAAEALLRDRSRTTEVE